MKRKVLPGIICFAVFLILEAASLHILSRNAQLQRLWVARGAHWVMAHTWGATQSVRSYFSLSGTNKQLSQEKREILEQMLFRFKAVKDAEDKKYVRMNAPKARLQEIIDVLPGLKSPTIIPLADDEWCSVHTVLDQKQFWDIIGKLKEMGAQGILVTPIEKMIM